MNHHNYYYTIVSFDHGIRRPSFTRWVFNSHWAKTAASKLRNALYTSDMKSLLPKKNSHIFFSLTHPKFHKNLQNKVIFKFCWILECVRPYKIAINILIAGHAQLFISKASFIYPTLNMALVLFIYNSHL